MISSHDKERLLNSKASTFLEQTEGGAGVCLVRIRPGMGLGQSPMLSPLPIAEMAF